MRCFCTKTKSYHCKVVLLDDQELLQEILDATAGLDLVVPVSLEKLTLNNTSTGQEVLDTVFRHLNLIETSYFGLRYIDYTNQTHWLDTTKKIAKQLKGKDSFTLYFGVKFYAVDPCKLVEEITRYQFFLQVKQDILQARLPVPNDLLAELGAYAVQSELGDYDPRIHGPGYVSEFRFVSSQTVELETKIAELHKNMQGQLPAVAELNYLDKVKWLELYGVDLHPVIGEDNVEYFLGITPSGVIVLRNKFKVASYFWSRIKKIYFKGKYFMLRVCDKNNEENTYGFETPSRAACKHLYKCCKEHHSFFQLVHVTTNAPDVVNTRFSSNRLDKLSGRSSQLDLRNPPSFVRTPSRKYQRRVVDKAAEGADPKMEEKVPMTENIAPEETKNIYVTQTSNSFYGNRSDSPRSTRSAPWSVWSTSGPPRNTHSSHSPRSVRSAGPQLRLTPHTRRSSSVESQSSIDSRPSCRRHKHRSKRGSDNESDPSRCSSHGLSHGHGSHRRHRHRSRRSSGSEPEHYGHHSSRRNRYQLIDSEGQWKEVQRRQAEGSTGIQEATVIRPGSGYANSGIETENEHSSCRHNRRKHRKHRSRSRSPSEGGKAYLPDELKKHLEFQLVDTEGMSEDQLREIPYTVVKTNAAKAVRVRLPFSGQTKAHSMRRVMNEDSPPPPYSEIPVLADVSNKATSTNTTTAATPNGTNKMKHHTRLPSHFMRSHGANQRTSHSALYGDPSMTTSTLLGTTNHPSQTALSGKDVEEKNAWLSGNAKFSNLGFVVGLPPQPQGRRSFTNTPSHSDLSLNLSRSQSHKAWPSPEIRGTVGLPWSPISEQAHTPSVNDLYLTADATRRIPDASLVDYNNANYNLEHRSTDGDSTGLAFRNSPKAGPQSAGTPLGQNLARSVSGSIENERSKRQNTLAECGVLRSHAITPNGKMAWPNERQLGWPSKGNDKQAINQTWCNSDADWTANEYSQWNSAELSPAASNDMTPLNWQTQQQYEQQSQLQPLSYRAPDRAGLYSTPSQMQRINENVTGEALADIRLEYVNFVNNNHFVRSDKCANNNQMYQQLNGTKAGIGAGGSLECLIEVKVNAENDSNVIANRTCFPSDDTKNNNSDHPNHNRSASGIETVGTRHMKQFIQEMRTEL